MTEEEKRSYLYANDIELRDLVYKLHLRVRELEEQLIADNVNDPARKEFIRTVVLDAVKQVYGMTHSITNRALQKTPRPRQLAMYFMIKHKAGTLKEIGDLFGGFGHDTVIYSIKKIEDLVEIKDKDVYPLYVKANLVINGRINSHNKYRAAVLPGAKRA